MNRRSCSNRMNLPAILRGRPQAIARISGGEEHPELSGMVRFYQTGRGVLVWAQISGLPKEAGACGGRIFGFHIHGGTECKGDGEDPFAGAMTHYNPRGCEHPDHAGDLPVLFGNDGFALSLFLTNRFSANEVLGKVVVIHDKPDDFTTQPSGNSGRKIACGVIEKSC